MNIDQLRVHRAVTVGRVMYHDSDVDMLLKEIDTLRAQLAEAQKRAEAAEKEFTDHRQAFHPDWDQVEAAKSSIREHMAKTKAAVERAEAAEERVKELEERNADMLSINQKLNLWLASEYNRLLLYQSLEKAARNVDVTHIIPIGTSLKTWQELQEALAALDKEEK